MKGVWMCMKCVQMFVNVCEYVWMCLSKQKHIFYSINFFCSKETCFACRRRYRKTTTYMNENTPKRFCDVKVLSTKISKKCNRCNLNLLSENCAKYHKLLCNGRFVTNATDLPISLITALLKKLNFNIVLWYTHGEAFYIGTLNNQYLQGT